MKKKIIISLCGFITACIIASLMFPNPKSAIIEMLQDPHLGDPIRLLILITVGLLTVVRFYSTELILKNFPKGMFIFGFLLIANRNTHTAGQLNLFLTLTFIGFVLGIVLGCCLSITGYWLSKVEKS